jgi:hypothetical protein
MEETEMNIKRAFGAAFVAASVTVLGAGVIDAQSPPATQVVAKRNTNFDSDGGNTCCGKHFGGDDEGAKAFSDHLHSEHSYDDKFQTGNIIQE